MSSEKTKAGQEPAKPAQTPPAAPKPPRQRMVLDNSLAAVQRISDILGAIPDPQERGMVLGWVLARSAPPGFAFSNKPDHVETLQGERKPE